jgi:hypothetical protein
MASSKNISIPSRFVYQIGQDMFWVEVWMYNFLSNYPPIQIPFFFINQLVIQETLIDWNVRGYLILENDYETFERGAGSYVSSSNGTNNSTQIKAPFLFRTDGRNKISVKIYPYTETENNIGDNLDPAWWQMCFDFVIYDIQDTPGQDPTKKLKTLYFKDERHQVFSERNIEWSTSINAKIGAKDSERTMYGNDALQSLINQACIIGGDSKKTLNIGYDKDASIDKPNIPLNVFDTKQWAAAPGDPSSKIFYTSPAHHNVLNDIEYLLTNSKASDGSPVILEFGRWEGDKSWKLIPLSFYFKNSQQNQIERLLIDDGMDFTNSPPAIPRAEFTTSSAIHNFTSGIASTISNYHYVPMVPMDDQLICNSPLFNYDFSKSLYNIYFNKNKISEVLNSTAKMAQNGLFNFKQNQSNQILLNVNKTKSSGLMTRNFYTPQSFFLQDYPQLKMIKDLVFLGGGIYFQVPGLTFRTPGKFIFIDRMAAGDKNAFDDKFLGQWMLTKVTHSFTKNGYINDVMATKIDAFSKIYPDQDTSY